MDRDNQQARPTDWAFIGYVGYSLGSLATFIYLTFFDGLVYNAWNWLLVVPINGFLAGIWPMYWAVLRPLFGDGG
jgi:hypothetical protein